VRLDLRTEAETEPAVRGELEVVRRLRERHRIAGERDRDRGRELYALGVLGREEQREERVVLTLEAEDIAAVEAPNLSVVEVTEASRPATCVDPLPSP